jgi:mono/diheme cytochrome c family protein
MRHKARNLGLSIGFAMFVTGCGKAANGPREMNHNSEGATLEFAANSRPDSPVHTIVMPHDEPLFPPGPGRDEFITACVVCHSPRYITMQPRFSRATWLSEVKKMKDVYGAHISDEQAAGITDYLVSINGKADTGTAPKGTYGE